MNFQWLLEIHFHQQEEASVSLKDNVIKETQKVFGELTLFSCFTCRELVNLGDDKVASGVASALSQVTGGLTALAYHDSPGGARIVDYKGSLGEKRFISSLNWTEKGFAFSSNSKGFGWLSRGYGYYAPQAILVLLKYLTRQRIKEPIFVMKLEDVAAQCGQAYLNRRLGITTSQRIAVGIAAQAMGPSQ
jgi:hypothetical protein